MDFVSLSPQQHSGLRYTPDQSFLPLRTEMMVPLAASECARVAREGTLVKLKDRDQVVLLAGLDLGQCQYISESGHWRARYVPAALRHYPFRLVDVGAQNFQVQIDLKAPHWAAPGGAPLFLPDGEHAPLLERVREVLVKVQQDLMRTQHLARQLDEAGLWMTQHLTFGQGEAKSAITGLQVIDIKKLAALGPEPLALLHRSGALALAYAQAHSMSNLQDGVLAESLRHAPATPNPDFDFEGLDDIDWGRLQ
jgi:hypothetical protein